MSTPTPFITFIVPVYHIPEAMFCECLQSIFSLPLMANESEVIVVDDGNESDIAASWSAEWKQRVCLIRQSNQGQAMARNAALDRARGEYVQFVDADDYLLPSLYAEAICFLKQHTDADMLSFSIGAGANTKEWMAPSAVQTGAHFMETHNLCTAPWGYIFKKDIADGIRFRSHKLYEDIEFTTRIYLSAQRLYATQTMPYYYRMRQGSVTNSSTIRQHAERDLPLYEQILFRLQTLPIRPEQQAALDRRVTQLAMDHVYNAMRYTHSLAYLRGVLSRLQAHGLYPFPNKQYTRKYTLFRHMVHFAPTRWLLTFFLR